MSKHYLKDIFRLLREKPAMLITGNKDSLETYIVYFQGFGLGYDISNNTNFENEISNWYHKKFKTKAFNMVWSTCFSKKYHHLPEKEKIVLFLDRVEEFMLTELIEK